MFPHRQRLLCQPRRCQGGDDRPLLLRLPVVLKHRGGVSRGLAALAGGQRRHPCGARRARLRAGASRVSIAYGHRAHGHGRPRCGEHRQRASVQHSQRQRQRAWSPAVALFFRPHPSVSAAPLPRGVPSMAVVVRPWSWLSWRLNECCASRCPRCRLSTASPEFAPGPRTRPPLVPSSRRCRRAPATSVTAGRTASAPPAGSPSIPRPAPMSPADSHRVVGLCDLQRRAARDVGRHHGDESRHRRILRGNCER